ncbi:hypothetical protein PIROE2DRAFT_57929 [Piromyces sp. E2]|nr:hypothetical protein PIROE2DRAFT_57929 [Piromyces sp. E2]|eukprot:OUM68719.1 hypothetical protein PIROE2DRAFT_57929 [Piromyces sp. E2]
MITNIIIQDTHAGVYSDNDNFEMIYFNNTHNNNDINKNSKNNKSIFLLLLGFITLLYRYRKRKFNKDNYILHSDERPDGSSKFKKFFPFNTFKNANKYANGNRATKTILDSNNVIMFNVDGCQTNTPGKQSNISNNNVVDTNNINHDSNTKRLFKKIMNNCKKCHIEFIIFLDSLLKIRISEKNTRYYEDLQQRKRKAKEKDDIQMTEIPITSNNDIGCCSYNINNNDINNFEKMLNQKSSKTCNNAINEKENNSEIESSSSSSNGISESAKAKLWNSIPVSNIKDRDKYTKNEAFDEIISVSSYKTTNDNSNISIDSKIKNNNKNSSYDQNESTESTLDSHNKSSPENTSSNGNFRISAITDNILNDKKGTTSNNKLSEPIISNNNLYNSSTTIYDDNEINDENVSINVENDEINSLINKNIENEKNLSWISGIRDSGINGFSKRVSGFLSLSFSKHNSIISESINEKISELTVKSKQKEIANKEENEVLLSEKINGLKTENIQNDDSNDKINTEPITIEKNAEFVDHKNSVSGSINTYSSNFDSILNMYSTNNFNENNTELDEKYVFTTKNSNTENNNNNKLSESENSFINPKTLTYIDGIKNKILKHNSNATKNVPSNHSSLKKIEDIKGNDKNDDNIESIHSHNPFLNGNIRNIFDNRNSIQSEQINNNYNSSISSSFYSCRETENNQNDNTQSYTTDSNIINVFENDDLFVYISNNKQMNVTVCPADVISSNSSSYNNSIDHMLNDMLNNQTTSIQRSSAITDKYNPFESNNNLIIPRKSSKRIANRQRDLLYSRNGMKVPSALNINEKMKEIPTRSSSVNYMNNMNNGSVNENSKLLNRKYMSYWNYETLTEDELTVYVGDIVYVIRVFNDVKWEKMKG